jgi:hypothetical protein
MVRRDGLEPSTHALKGHSSNRFFPIDLKLVVRPFAALAGCIRKLEIRVAVSEIGRPAKLLSKFDVREFHNVELKSGRYRFSFNRTSGTSTREMSAISTCSPPGVFADRAARPRRGFCSATLAGAEAASGSRRSKLQSVLAGLP